MTTGKLEWKRGMVRTQKMSDIWQMIDSTHNRSCGQTWLSIPPSMNYKTKKAFCEYSVRLIFSVTKLNARANIVSTSASFTSQRNLWHPFDGAWIPVGRKTAILLLVIHKLRIAVLVSVLNYPINCFTPRQCCNLNAWILRENSHRTKWVEAAIEAEWVLN